MAFFDQLLDPSITQGAQGGPTVTGRSKTYLPGGKMRQNFLAAVPVHKYDVSHGIRTAAQRQAIIDLWYVVMFTPYSGFRFRDWSDYQATQANSSCTLISGSVYQLNRVHTYGTIKVSRPIYKPVNGSVTVWRTRSGVVSAATATIDYTTGQATISGHASGDTYTWTGKFDVPVTFSDDAWVDTLQANIQNLAIDCGEIKLEELIDPLSITPMKTLPTAYANHLAGPCTTIATALRITRTDGSVYGFTNAGQDAVIGGVTYLSSPGLDVTTIEQAAGLGVDNLELTTLHDESVFTTLDVASGKWTNAAFLLFRYNWRSPSDGTEPMLAGTLGEPEIRQTTLVVELRGLQQYLQQSIGNVSTKTCRARFADFPTPNGNNRCRLSAAAWTVSATVTAVADARRQFTASALTQADDWFAEGVLTWTSGDSAGLSSKVKAFSSGGAVTLLVPTITDIAVGDTFDILAGCRKRLDEDCATKFANTLNFQGEPHRPTTDQLTATGTPDV